VIFIAGLVVGFVAGVFAVGALVLIGVSASVAAGLNW